MRSIYFYASVLFAFITLSSVAVAQVPLMPEVEMPQPSLTNSIFKDLSATAFTLSSAEVDAIAQILQNQFQAAADRLKQSAPACTDAEAVNYAISLQAAGRFQDCIDFTRVCGVVSANPLVALRGGLCAAELFDYPVADEMFKMATDARFSSSADLSEAVFLYANYAMFGIHEDQVAAILKLQPAWSDSDRELFDGIIRRVGRTGGSVRTNAEVDAFIDQRIASGAPSMQALMRSLKLNVAYSDYRWSDALSELKNSAPLMPNPLLWYNLAYPVVYYGLDLQYVLARKVYDAYEPYTHSRSAMPNENNTYDYTELYSQVCKDQLTHGQEANHLAQFKDDLQNGRTTPAAAVQFLENFNQQHPNRADVLTALGSVYAMADRHQEAVDAYWKAHKLCRYYNRANWGLVLERRYAKVSRMPDFQKNLDRITRELANRPLPPDMPSYIINWNSLSAEAQRRVYYGARIWLPYIDDLVAGQRSTYIKYPFELLSETPQWASIRDARVSKAHDHRLWDDVRGIGGNPVVADLFEMMNTVQGDYNLLGHEMAHQFEFLMTDEFEPGETCITNLYQKGLRDNLFPDGYAKTNQNEHFAQEITYYLVPSDSPKRFGLNQDWLVKEDPTYLKFIQSIEAAAGDLQKIVCPIH